MSYRIRRAAALIVAASACIASPVSAQQDRVSATDQGSLLIFPRIELRWDAAGTLIQDTILSISNGALEDVNVLMYFVNGDPPLPADLGTGEREHPGWNHFSWLGPIAAEQPAFLRTSTGEDLAVPPFLALDPGFPPGRPDPEGTGERVLRGFMLAWAVDAAGQQIRWNHLTGSATVVNYPASSALDYGAYAVAAVAGFADGDSVGIPGVLELDGSSYALGFDRLLVDFQAAGSGSLSGGTSLVVTDGDLTVMPVSSDLREDGDGPVTTRLDLTVINENGVKLGGLEQCVTCWDERLLSLYGAPDFFTVQLLQSDRGRARIDGRAGGACDVDFDAGDGLPLGADPRDVVAEDASLLGVFAQIASIFGTGPASTVTGGTNLVGTGAEAAVILYDVEGIQPEATGGGQARVAPASIPTTTLAAAGRTSTPAPAPGAEGGFGAASATEKGSLLIYPHVELRFDAAGNLLQDTYLSLHNDLPFGVRVQLSFVHGDAPLDEVLGKGGVVLERSHTGWNHVDSQVVLLPDQAGYWSVFSGQPLGLPSLTTLDPGFPPGRPALDAPGERVLRGYVIAWAVDDAGAEIRWNHLHGSTTTVRYDHETLSMHTPYAVAAVAQVANGDALPGAPGVLLLDGVEYASAFDQLLVDFYAAGSAAFSSVAAFVGADAALTVHPVSVELFDPSARPVTTLVDATIWNGNSVKFTGTSRCVTCWDSTLLSDFADAGPNNFLLPLLQTDKGRARLDGLQNAACDVDADPLDGLPLGDDPLDVVTEDAALLGLISKRLEFDGGVSRAATALTLVGIGTQTAVIGCAPPDDEPCPFDLTGDDVIGFADLNLLLGAWGPCPTCPEDIDDNGTVGFSDLNFLLGAWGACP